VLHFVKTDGKRINTEMEPGIGLVLFLLSYYPVTATLLGGIIHTTAKIGLFFFFLDCKNCTNIIVIYSRLWGENICVVVIYLSK
jgi:hypothetical protein